MNTAIRVVVGTMFAAAVLSGVAFGQGESNEPTKTVHISGRIIDQTGTSSSEQTVNLRNLKMIQDTSTVKTDQSGRFSFSAASRTEYALYLTTPGVPYTDLTFRTVGVEGLELGNIAVQISSPQKATIEVLGPVKITESSSTDLNALPVQSKAAAIAVIYCTEGGSVHVIHSDGREIQPLKEKEQVGCKSPIISEDQRAVGWLVASDFCCTSYPISVKLVVYRLGKPLSRFSGDGRAIFRWYFVAGGKQVAFYQDFLHGTQAQHYELRDVETGRLIDKWDGVLTPKAPKWTRGMRM